MARKSQTERIDTLRQKQEQIKAQLAALEARQKSEDRKRDARRKIVVGAAVLAHAEIDPSFCAALTKALHAAVTRDIDRAVIADLLEGKMISAKVRGDETAPDHSGAVAT